MAHVLSSPSKTLLCSAKMCTRVETTVLDLLHNLVIPLELGNLTQKDLRVFGIRCSTLLVKTTGGVFPGNPRTRDKGPRSLREIWMVYVLIPEKSPGGHGSSRHFVTQFFYL